MATDSNKIKQKKSNNFYCSACDYYTDRKSNLNNHNRSMKHINATKCIQTKQPLSNNLMCETCNKQYQDRTGLWRHKKKCNLKINENKELISQGHSTLLDKDLITMIMNENVQLIKETQTNDIQNNVMMLSNLVVEVVKQNQEFQKMIIEQNNKIIELSSKSQVTNNNCTTTNAKFNLQFFLNETCKDAMNIMDFVDSVKLQLSDLEKVGNAGFVNGISNIIIKNLKDLDVTKRPLHCTDSKREVMYVKDDDKWEKENDEKDKMKKVINKISTKNIQQIPEWVEQHPDCKDSDSRRNNQYLHIVSESMGCCEPANYGKIIHNVSKQVIVDK